MYFSVFVDRSFFRSGNTILDILGNERTIYSILESTKMPHPTPDNNDNNKLWI